MSIKFGIFREVDHRYLNVPVKYILRYKGANEDGKDKYEYQTYEEWVETMADFFARNPWLDGGKGSLTKEVYEAVKKNGGVGQVCRKEAKDKTLCIVDFYGDKLALVAWRNNRTCKMGMTRICKVVHKNNNVYIQYRGKLILISDPSGWVF